MVKAPEANLTHIFPMEPTVDVGRDMAFVARGLAVRVTAARAAGDHHVGILTCADGRRARDSRGRRLPTPHAHARWHTRIQRATRYARVRTGMR